jgi:cytochrome c peroxidase
MWRDRSFPRAIGLRLGRSALLAIACAHLTCQGFEVTEEPITPLPAPPPADARKVALGEQLFKDKRLSRDTVRSCESCHDVSTNGATGSAKDVALDGAGLPLNTISVFNSTLSFRLGWRGEFRTLEAHAEATLQNPALMGARINDVVDKLRRDPVVVRQFRVVYRRMPDAKNLIDALAAFERSLITPESRFDRWLRGDTQALSLKEQEGYRLFKSLGCAACHQGVNVGGNLFQRHGIFRPIASPEPRIVRVPSLRNVATTAPYFHDGSAPSLEDAVKRMAAGQLNSWLTDEQAGLLVAYLNTLTGIYKEHTVRAPQ